jgi:hypothetical protein
MAETLLLARTVGRRGWEVAHAGASREFALAAVGQCFAQRGLLSNLPLLWRLRALWATELDTVDARELRLALAVDARVRLSLARIDLRITQPLHGAAAHALLEAALPLAATRGRDARLPALDDGLAWRVHAFSAEGARAFHRLARPLQSMARGARVELRVLARDSRSPPALRRAFPLRVELLFDPAEGYATVVPLCKLDLVPG